MKKSPEPDEVDVLLVRLLREVATGFTQASVATVPHRASGAPAWVLTCSAPGTASIEVFHAGDQIDVFAGKDTQLEFALTPKKTPDETLAELGRFVGAVTRGNFREVLWEAGGSILRSKGIFVLDEGYQEVSRRLRLIAMIWPGRRREIHYGPYV